jgi:hypothetical protein
VAYERALDLNPADEGLMRNFDRLLKKIGKRSG